MLRIELRFPLGVYHALAHESFGRPEWPPHPVRLLGALTAAAHEAPGVDASTCRALLERLCASEPPTIYAPDVASVTDVLATHGRASGVDPVVGFRGPSRWAPRNHEANELKELSTRNVARNRAEVHKSGVAIGSRTVAFCWPSVTLTPTELQRMQALADEVTYVGTSRSPVVLTVRDVDDNRRDDAWDPHADGHRGGTGVRVPDPGLLRAFDARHAAREARGTKPIASAEHVPNSPVGRVVPYLRRNRWRAQQAHTPFDPQRWGDMIVLELDADQSSLRPKASAAFLVARAFRQALLGNFGAIGSGHEAPPVLYGRGADPHVAIVPLPFVGSITMQRGRSGTEPSPVEVIPADGLIRGIALVLPHERLVPDIAEQRLAIEAALLRMLEDPCFALPTADDGPGAATQKTTRQLAVRVPNPNRPLLQTLRDERYRAPSRVWESVVPVVHARRRTSKGPRGVYRQVATDCMFVDLPEPVEVQVLARPSFGGAPTRLLPDHLIPSAWTGPLQGPRSHVRIVFDRPVVGPVLLGKARHFGVGLCLPNHTLDRQLARGEWLNREEAEAA